MALPTEQAPGVYHRRVGDIRVTALHDSHQGDRIALVDRDGDGFRLLPDAWCLEP